MEQTMKGADEPICATCAAAGKTCCQSTQVFVSGGDLERIAAATGGRDFFEYAAADRDEYNPDDDPLWARIFAADGRRRVLRHKGGRGGGDCMFLGDAGCVLAENVRPMICRLYPFEYDGDAIKGVSAHFCPESIRDNAPLVLALLGMNRDTAEEWRRTLYREIVEEFPEPA